MIADLSEVEAERLICDLCFSAGPPSTIGVELEWLVRLRRDRTRAVPRGRLQAALTPVAGPGELPGGSLLTLEPGGQVELSSLPARNLQTCIEALEEDQSALEQALAARGLVLDGSGFDAYRDAQRILEHPRYRTMEAYFDRNGPWGRMMMCATASVQINVDAGEGCDDASGYRHRWSLAHRLGPVLVAAFANSPLLDGRPSGWKSTRQAIWARLDPGRTRPVSGNGDGDARRAFARYAMDASLLCLRRDPPDAWTAPPGLTFRSWLRNGVNERRPTVDDLKYHLSTLFPPVRPRGWLELRMIDAQPGDGWIAPTAVTATLLDDPVAAAAAYEATENVAGGAEQPPWSTWLRAARFGLADPMLREAAQACFAVAVDSLRRTGAPARLRRKVSDYRERYVDRGRCPADDQLDVLTHDMLPFHRDSSTPTQVEEIAS